ncbi:hypothetical protein ACHAXS_008744 [Conticribra weissflogii]
MNPMNHPMNGSIPHSPNPRYDPSRSVRANRFFSRDSSSMSNHFIDEIDRYTSSSLTTGEEQHPPPVTQNDDAPIHRAKRFLLVSIVVLIGLIGGLTVALVATKKANDQNIHVSVEDAVIQGNSKTRTSPPDISSKIGSVDVSSKASNGLDSEIESDLATSDTNPEEVFVETTEATATPSDGEDVKIDAAILPTETSVNEDGLSPSSTSSTLIPGGSTELNKVVKTDKELSYANTSSTSISTETTESSAEKGDEDELSYITTTSSTSTNDAIESPTEDKTEKEDSGVSYVTTSSTSSSSTPAETTELPTDGKEADDKTPNNCISLATFHQNLMPKNPTSNCKGCIPRVSMDKDVAIVKYADKIFYFIYENGIWKELDEAYALSDGSGDSFDMPFALSGNISVVGDVASKVVYVIDGSLQDNPENEVMKLEPPEDSGSEARFGFAVHIHRDTMVVGAPFLQAVSTGGIAYIYRRKNDSWILEAVLESRKSTNFGEEVTIGENILVVSGQYNQERTLFLFEYDPTLKIWKLMHRIQHVDHDCITFGASLAFTDDNELVVGCPNEEDNTGALYYYVLSSGKYEFTQKVTASDRAAGDFFGDQISVSGDVMVVGAPGAETKGHAYIFRLLDGGWTEASIILSPFREVDFGDSLSVSGNKMIISSENGAYYYSFDACSQHTS